MSAHEEETTIAAELLDAIGKTDGTNIGFSPDMIEERIKANL